MIGDKCLGLVEAIREVFPNTEYQRCIVHFMRNVFCNVPRLNKNTLSVFFMDISTKEMEKSALSSLTDIY